VPHDIVISSEVVGKPFCRSSYAHSRQSVEVPANAVVYIGDASCNDFEGGAAAGFVCMLFRTPWPVIRRLPPSERLGKLGDLRPSVA